MSIKETQNNKPAEILSLVKSTKRALIIMDSRFDYDSLGSVLAFGYVLNYLEIPYDCVFGYEIPQKAKRFFDTQKVTENVDLKALNYNPYDLIIILDCGDYRHLTKDLDYMLPNHKNILNIDHHEVNSRYGKYNYVYNDSSTTRVLYRLFTAWKIPLTKNILNYLMVGLITDTGIFQNPNTKSDDFALMSKFIKLGANYQQLIDFLTKNEPIPDVMAKRNYIL